MDTDLTLNAAVSGVRDPASSRLYSCVGWVAVAGAFWFSMFWGSQSFGLQDNNEGLYAEIAREMVVRRDWVVPHLNGLPYLEKPPLLYWLVAGLFRLFGEHEWVVRLGPAICFGGTLAAVIWMGCLVGATKAGRNAAVLMCSAVGIVGMSRSLLFDAPLTCVMAWMLAIFLHWRLTGARRSLLGYYVLVGVGVMTKGAVAVVFGAGAAVICTIVAESSLPINAPRLSAAWRALLRLWDGMGAMLFVAVAAPWHVLVARREPGFAEFYLLNEHVKRFLGTREPHDFYTGPFYYYVERLPLYFGVWIFPLLLLMPGRQSHLVAPDRSITEARRLLGAVALFAFGFFSVSEGKANYYLLCVMPAFALLLALAWPHEGVRSRRLLLASGSLVAFAAVFGAAPFVVTRKPEVAGILRANLFELGCVATALLGLASAAWHCAWRGRNGAAFWTVAAAGLTMLLPLPSLLHAADPMLSQRELVQFLAAIPAKRVVLYRDYEALSSLPFYLGRPVPIFDSQSNELHYARHHCPNRGIFLNETALRDLVRKEAVWLVTTPKRTEEALNRFHEFVPRLVKQFPGATVLLLAPP